MNTELGHISIYFGKIESVDDELKICRCQVSIKGHTDQIPVADLPWYYPAYGRNYLPLVGDTVAVKIYDGNFSTGEYGRKIDLEDAGVDEGDYANYLEIFKRQCGSGDVQLTYKESTGIELLNGKSKLQIEAEKYSMFCDGNSIIMTKDKIEIGSGTKEATLNGETTRDLIEAIITHLDSYENNLETLLQTVQSAASGSPYTANIGGALAGQIPNLKTTHSKDVPNLKTNVKDSNTLSKMVFVNK